jgi:DNA-directed RNA polymerase subunit K/omega
MSQYEATALLALRTQQLAMGCRSTLADAATAGKTPQQIAQLELDCNAVPIVVSRVLPDGSHHDIPARWLRVPGDFRP